MSIIQTKPFHFFVEFARVDPSERIVEGYCYVNAKIKADKWNLEPAAIQRAAQDYMKWGAIREMHQPSAVGTALATGCGVEFDGQGRAKIRAKIVDDNAWNKVCEGVYRGFSIGGQPTVVRGNAVKEFTWVETSLVDRPADPETVITVWRAQGIDMAAEAETVEEEEGPEEETEKEDPDSADSEDESEDTDGGEGKDEGEDEDKGEDEGDQGEAEDDEIEKEEIAERLMQTVQRLAQTTVLTRLIQVENGTLVQRLEQAESQLVNLQRSLDLAQAELEVKSGEIERLSLEPIPVQSPVRYPAALSREFLANQGQEQYPDVARLRSEFAELKTELENEASGDKRQEGVARLNVIRQELSRYGVMV